MNVVFLSPVGFFKGGAERSLFDLLSNPALTPVLVAPEEREVLEKGRGLGIPCHVLPFGDINNIHRPFSFVDGLKAVRSLFTASCALKKIAKAHNAPVVHSNGLKAHAINCVSRWMGGAKAIVHIRDIPYTKPEKIVWKIMQCLCDEMILVSRPCWPGDTLPKNVHVIHNGTQIVDAIEGTATNTDGKIIFGFCGRIHPGKGLHLLIDWLGAARKEGLNAYLTVRGSFSEDAPHYEREIQESIRAQNLMDYVEFCGFINSKDALYRGIDIVVVPSDTPDPLPRSVMEAMALGLPVFGYPAGGITDMIDHGKSGFLVQDSRSFIAATREVTSNPDFLKTLGIVARQKIADTFSMEKLHENMTAVYKRLGA